MWRIGEVSERLYRGQIVSFLELPQAFNTFKSNPHYISVIGAPSIHQAMPWFRLIKEDPEVWKNIDEFMRADSIGMPNLYSLSGKKISLNLIRQINTIQLLKKEFGSLDGKRIVEIGAGWGGLLHCIKTQWKPASYNVVDLPEAMDLVEKHSEMLGHTVTKGMCEEPPDLAIAEYSITEQDGQELMDLTTDYLFPAKNVFVRCNVYDQAARKRWVDLMQVNFNLSISQENPDIVKFNSIVVGRQ